MYIKTFKLFEKRVPRSERIELYRDSNIVIVVPLTFEAQKKYGSHCQWCINRDFHEWKEYHKGEYVIITQRKPLPQKKGITGSPTAQEIFALEQGIFGMDYKKFETEKEEVDYLIKLTNDINSFDLNTVYYGRGGIMYDKENNPIHEYNRDSSNNSKFSIKDIPNVTDEVINKINSFFENGR
jgi:ABC-type antimicrobial peptide transport system permease subunit